MRDMTPSRAVQGKLALALPVESGLHGPIRILGFSECCVTEARDLPTRLVNDCNATKAGRQLWAADKQWYKGLLSS